jgi:hypothetical protein
VFRRLCIRDRAFGMPSKSIPGKYQPKDFDPFLTSKAEELMPLIHQIDRFYIQHGKLPSDGRSSKKEPSLKIPKKVDYYTRKNFYVVSIDLDLNQKLYCMTFYERLRWPSLEVRQWAFESNNTSKQVKLKTEQGAAANP